MLARFCLYVGLEGDAEKLCDRVGDVLVLARVVLCLCYLGILIWNCLLVPRAHNALVLVGSEVILLVAVRVQVLVDVVGVSLGSAHRAAVVSLVDHSFAVFVFGQDARIACLAEGAHVFGCRVMVAKTGVIGVVLEIHVYLLEVIVE